AFAMRDQPVNSVAAEHVAHRLQQIQRELRMPVGEAGVPVRGQPPASLRSSPPALLLVACDQPRRFEPEQMLARARPRHAEADADVGGALRAARLQMKQDAVLTTVLALIHVALI